MKIAFIGDLHGDVGTTRRIIKELPNDLDLILQVGDFGYWPERNDFHAFVKCYDDLFSKARLGFHWIDGNHEDHHNLDANPRRMVTEGHLPHGSLTTFEGVTVLALGGGVSIDRYHRTEGRSWFPQEAPTITQLVDAHAAATKLSFMPTIPIVVSHEAPAVRVPFRGLPYQIPEELLYGSTLHRLALEEIYRVIALNRDDFIWVHGHWHEYGAYIPGFDALLNVDPSTPGAVIGLDESRASFDDVVHILDTDGIEREDFGVIEGVTA